MKKFTYSVLTALVASLVLTSCLGEDEEKVYSDYCNISAFSLGSIKQIHHTLSSKGADSTYTTVFAGSVFPMSINQRELTIENHDSLPYGALVDRVLTKCTFESVLVQRPADIRNLLPEDTVWVGYSEKDSIDFTVPRHYWVFAANGEASRTYTVKVNVHQMDPDKTHWDSLGVAEQLCPATCLSRKMMVLGDCLKLMIQSTDGTLCLYSRGLQTSGEWAAESISGIDGLLLETLQQAPEGLYASTSAGNLLYSADGKEWQTRMLGMPGLRLVGVSTNCFYAMVGGKLMSSTRSDESWKEEVLDDEATLLPGKDVTLTALSQTNGNQRLLMTGKSADGSAPRLWSKMWTSQNGNELASGWTYYSQNGAVKNSFPLLSQQNVLLYNEGVVLLGGAPVQSVHQNAGVTDEDEALGNIFYSPDYGVTWQKHAKLTTDDRMQESAAKADFITVASQDGKYLWVLIDGQLWRGRLNKLIFNK